MQGLAARVKAACSVLVVGGGPLGVELAGEVLTVRGGDAVEVGRIAA
jgi:NADH dehydrogenase FAD-containing subunit